MLTAAGLAHSWALGVMLWSALGWRGWSTCVLYLVLGSAVTKLGRKKKELRSFFACGGWGEQVLSNVGRPSRTSEIHRKLIPKFSDFDVSDCDVEIAIF